MTDREKIIETLNKNFMEKEMVPVYVEENGKETELPQELCEIFNDIVEQALIPCFADALIAAGIGDTVELKQELKAQEGSANAYRICFEEQKYWREVAEHRAEVAELALRLSYVDSVNNLDVYPFPYCLPSYFREALVGDPGAKDFLDFYIARAEAYLKTHGGKL